MSAIGGIAKNVGKDPFVLIGILISIQIVTSLVTTTFPTILTGLVSLNSLNNFTFSGLFASSGLMQLIISAVVLVAVLVTLGVKMSGSKR